MTHRWHLLRLPFLLLLLTAAPALAFAGGGGSDRVHVFQNIDIGPDERVGDVVCLVCSIHNAGTSGDNVAILGNIQVDGVVNGDVVAVGGGILLRQDASVSGDTVGIGRGIQRHPNAVVKGEMISQSGPIIFLGLVLGLIVVPLLPIVLIVAVIVWLFRRSSQPRPAQAAYRR